MGCIIGSDSKSYKMQVRELDKRTQRFVFLAWYSIGMDMRS